MGATRASRSPIGSTFSTRLSNQSYLARPGQLADELRPLAPGTTIVLDEIQRLPALLNEVHRFIEERRLRFVLCGSLSARKLTSWSWWMAGSCRKLLRSKPYGDYRRSRTAWTMTIRRSSRLRCPACAISSSASPMTICWMLWAGTAPPVLGPAISAVTSSQARARNPAASTIARISSGRRQNAGGGIPRPHHRKDRRLHGTCHRLLHREQAALAEQTRKTGVEALLVGNVHAAVLCPDTVEGIGADFESQRVARAMSDAIGEPEPSGQGSARAHVGFGEIDHGDVTAEVGGQGARRPAQPTADVENAQPGSEAGQVRQPHGGILPAAVKLIAHGEVVDGQCVHVLACRGQRRENRAFEAVAPPVVVYRPRVARFTHAENCSARAPFNASRPAFPRRRQALAPSPTRLGRT